MGFLKSYFSYNKSVNPLLAEMKMCHINPNSDTLDINASQVSL